MTLVIKPQQRYTWWHWSVLTLVGLSVTYSWLWVLTYRPVHQPEIEMGSEVEGDSPTLDIFLETQQSSVGQPSTREAPVESASTSTHQSASMAAAPPEQVAPIEAVVAVAAFVPPTLAPELPAPTLVSIQNISPPPQSANPIIPAVFKPTAQDVVPPKPFPAPVDNTPSSTAADNTLPKSATAAENSVVTNTVKLSPLALPAAAGLEPVPVSRLTRTPAFVHKALPTDPEDVQIPLGGVRVIARITLDETAAVRDVQIDKSGEPPFDVAVISAIHRSRFTPGYVGNQPVATVFNQTYRFQLQ